MTYYQKIPQMNNRIIFIILLTAAHCSSLWSQGVADALRFSSYDFGSTARAVGSGSALGALGADFSVLSTNPAGLGWYRKSEFVLSTGIANSSTQALLTNDQAARFSEETRSVFNIPSFGVVVASQPSNLNWATFNFGIGLNRIANFNRALYFNGSSEGSITDRFLELANSNFGLDDFESGLAFDAEAIYDFNNDNIYNSDFELSPGALVRKNQNVLTKGSINELVFSFAGNYKERVLIGATLGVPFVSFSQNKTYAESDEGDGPDGAIPFFEDLEYSEELTSTGIGVNFKFGLILRLHQMLRIGAAVHSPTSYSLEDNYFSSMVYNYTDSGESFTGSATSPDGIFEYKLQTPWRYIGNVGLVFGKAGFLSGEVEWVDYGKAKFNFDDFASDAREANDEIVNQLSTAVNIRLGGEFAYDIFRFRGGLGILASPYANDNTLTNSYSAGFGIRERSFFIDLAYRHRSLSETYIPYLTSEAPQQFVDADTDNNQLLLTLGFKF